PAPLAPAPPPLGDADALVSLNAPIGSPLPVAPPPCRFADVRRSDVAPVSDGDGGPSRQPRRVTTCMPLSTPAVPLGRESGGREAPVCGAADCSWSEGVAVEFDLFCPHAHISAATPMTIVALIFFLMAAKTGKFVPRDTRAGRTCRQAGAAAQLRCGTCAARQRSRFGRGSRGAGFDSKRCR